MVEVLLAVDGHTERWRGEVVRSTHSSVELRPFGCASTIEFEVEQALEIFAWTTKGINAASIASIEQTQAQRLAKRRSGR